MAGSDGALAALYPAVAAIVVAGCGLVGNIILARRRRGEDPEDVHMITALAQALAAAERKAADAERRAAECEGREQLRKHRRG